MHSFKLAVSQKYRSCQVAKLQAKLHWPYTPDMAHMNAPGSIFCLTAARCFSVLSLSSVHGWWPAQVMPRSTRPPGPQTRISGQYMTDLAIPSALSKPCRHYAQPNRKNPSWFIQGNMHVSFPRTRARLAAVRPARPT